MRLRRFAAAAFATALCAYASDAMAFTASMALSKDKTTARYATSERHPSPYARALLDIILAEVKRTHLPFAIASPFVFLVRFDFDRKGRLLDVKILQGANIAVANEYAETIVKRAALRFPPPPADMAGDRHAFVLPLIMRTN